MITFNNIVSKFQAFCDDHFFIKTFSYGSPADVDLEKFEQYPLMHLVYTGGDYNTERTKTYNLEVYILTLPPSEADKNTHQKESISDAEQVAEDILADIQNGGNIFQFGYHYDLTSASVTPLEEENSNALAGCLLDLSIAVPYSYDSCNAPLTGVDPEGSRPQSYRARGLLRVKEADGSPDVLSVATIVVPNGSLTDDGDGQITLNFDDRDTYLNRFDSTASTMALTLDAGTATIEKIDTARWTGTGQYLSQQSDTPTAGKNIVRKVYYDNKFGSLTAFGSWTLIHTFANDTSYATAEAYINDKIIAGQTNGTAPASLVMTWEEVDQFDGLLDTYGGAAAAYSVRRLSSSYTGSLIQVERASDNTTQDIGYDSNGDLDTAAIATFCSGTTCGVRVWYDQSGNGNDATQTTFANQPTIYTGGAVVTENTKPALDFDGINDVFVKPITLTDTGDNFVATFIAVAQSNNPTSNNAASFVVSINPNLSAVDRRFYQLSLENTQVAIRNQGGNTIFNAGDGDSQCVFTAAHIATNSASVGRLNGTDLSVSSSANVSLNMQADSAIVIGSAGSPTSYTSIVDSMDGKIQEILYYASDQYTTNRTGIETNVNDYFGIYTPFTTGLLDDYGGAAAAYSLRRLSSTYTGSAIRVRRASDNAEQDIGFDIEGNLNTAALASFCSGTDGFVKTWYCQSGNGNDATQTTTANQPKIYDSATGVVTENGKPAIQSVTNVSSLTHSVVSRGYNHGLFAVCGPSTDWGKIWDADFTIRASTILRADMTGQVLQFNMPDMFTNQQILTMIADGTEIRAYRNATESTTGAKTLTGGGTNLYQIFNSYDDGKIQELVFYQSDQSSNRTGIESNINTFYSIY